MRYCLVLFSIVMGITVCSAEGVRIKDMARVDGVRDNSLVGFGLVTGLASTGDSTRSKATLQSISNMLLSFGIKVTPSQLQSRNVAAVMVTATLPPFARSGDKLDVTVSSVGDARSIFGGTLLMTPLYGPDKKLYALAQGSLSVGGYKFSQFGNVSQKNHPTAGTIPQGATVEASVPTKISKDNSHIYIILHKPDFTTSNRIVQKVNESFGGQTADAVDAGRIRISIPKDKQHNIVQFVAGLENLVVAPGQRAMVVVNERTGTIVSGGNVRISQVTISHGNLHLSIKTDFLVSQPTLLVRSSQSIRTQVVPRTQIGVNEGVVRSVSLKSGATVAELVAALNSIQTKTRDVISILQGIKRAGALHAELVIQ